MQEDAKEVASKFYVSIKTQDVYLNCTSKLVVFSISSHKILSESEELVLLNALLDTPGIFLDEVQQHLFEKCGKWVSTSTLCREAKRMGLTRQKMRKIAIQRSDMAHASFMVQVDGMNADMFVWVDETGSDKRHAARKYAYSLRGVTPINNCLYYVPGKRISAISAVSTRGVEDVYLTEGGVDGKTFCDFIRKCLLPNIMPFNGSNPRSIVVLDNASIHYADEAVQLLSNAGALLWFLPPYNPDLNPIEQLII